MQCIYNENVQEMLYVTYSSSTEGSFKAVSLNSLLTVPVTEIRTPRNWARIPTRVTSPDCVTHETDMKRVVICVMTKYVF